MHTVKTEIAWQIRAHADLEEDLSLAPSTHAGQLIATCSSSFRVDPMPLVFLGTCTYTHHNGAHAHTHTLKILIIKLYICIHM